MDQLTAPQLAQMLLAGEKLTLLDVREPWEFDVAKLPDSTLLPMGEVPARIDELDPSMNVVCICHHGVRSMQVAYFLNQRGFETVYNLQGGIDAWAREVDPQCATY